MGCTRLLVTVTQRVPSNRLFELDCLWYCLVPVPLRCLQRKGPPVEEGG